LKCQSKTKQKAIAKRSDKKGFWSKKGKAGERGKAPFFRGKPKNKG
jgi:hypothetical protein